MQNDKQAQHRRPATIGLPAHLTVPEAEAAVLGAVMTRGAAAFEDASGLISAEDMWHPANAATFTAMARLHERGEHIDTISLNDQLRRTGELELVGGLEALVRLDGCAAAHNVKAYASIVLHASQLRAAWQWHRDQAEAICRREDLTDDDEWETFIGKARSRFAELTSTGAKGVELRSSGSVVESLLERLEDLAHGRAPSASLGFAELDDLASPRPGDLVGLIARSGDGKTALALSLTVALTLTRDQGQWVHRADASPVLWASAEMSSEDVTARMVSIVSDIDGKMMRPDRRRSQQDKIRDFDRIRSRLAAAGRLIDEAPITFVPDDDARHLDGIIAGARKFVAELPPHRASESHPVPGVPVMFIDYLTLLRVRGTYAREDLKWAHVTTTLKHLAAELGIVIVLLAQVNKVTSKREGGRCRIEDIRECGQLEHDAVIVLSIYRPARAAGTIADLYEIAKRLGADRRNLSHAEAETLRETEAKIAESYIDALKARNGELGSVATRFVGRCTRFEIPDEGEA
jgi:replicative DNA helicase